MHQLLSQPLIVTMLLIVTSCFVVLGVPTMVIAAVLIRALIGHASSKTNGAPGGYDLSEIPAA